MRQPFRSTLRHLLIFVVACSVGCFVLLRIIRPAIERSEDAAARAQCTNHLLQIGLALNIYHDVHGCFPPPFLADPSGKPTHSWRRLLLDYLDSHPLGTVWPVDLAQPWDSSKNLAAAKRMPPCYSCPAAGPSNENAITNYVMIVGKKTVAKPDGHASRNEIRDDVATTIIVAEIADSDILWTEPRDLRLDEMSHQINDESTPSISSHHFNGALVLCADGGVRFLDDSTSPEELMAMLTRAGND